MISGVYINLERATERRELMERQLEALALPFEVTRLPAVDGAARGDRPPALTAGQFGCWQSHLGALERSLASEDHLYVVEDDALLSPALAELPELVDAMDAATGGDWDLLYLDATVVEVEDMCSLFEWTERARRDGRIGFLRVPSKFTLYGTLSYVVNARRKQRVLAFLRENLGRGKAIDSIVAHGINTGALKACVTLPLLTSGSELARTSEVDVRDDGRNLAWLLFRRLCYIGREEEGLPQLGAEVAELTRKLDEPQKLLGLLVSHRVVAFPNARFAPLLGEK